MSFNKDDEFIYNSNFSVSANAKIEIMQSALGWTTENLDYITKIYLWFDEIVSKKTINDFGEELKKYENSTNYGTVLYSLLYQIENSLRTLCLNTLKMYLTDHSKEKFRDYLALIVGIGINENFKVKKFLKFVEKNINSEINIRTQTDNIFDINSPLRSFIFTPRLTIINMYIKVYVHRFMEHKSN